MSAYTEALTTEGRDLVKVARAGRLPRVLHRDREIDAAIDALDRGQSVLLVGTGGAGKTAVIHGIAQRLAKKPRAMVQYGANQILQGTRFLGEWQTKAGAVAEQAHKSRIVVYLPDIWTLSVVGRSSNTDNSVLEMWRPLIESGDLQVVGEVTPETLGNMERVPRFVSLFRRVPVAPLGMEEAREVVKTRTGVDDASIDSLFEVTGRFAAQTPQPGPALALADQVDHYRREKESIGEPAAWSRALIERVFCVYSGLPEFVVSRSSTRSAADIRGWFEERIIGQRAAIDAVVEAIALYKAGLNDPGRPIGTFLFVGPTGVGKTELAKALASFLFGSETRMLRFDMSEYKDYHSFQQLIGTPGSNQPATLIDPVRSRPFQLILLDEIEKAHANVWDLMLQVLDDGRLTPPGGTAVNFRNTIIICTSNVGAQGSDKSVGFGNDPDERQQSKSILGALEAHFRPELLNRFQHLVVFHPLNRQHVKAIAEHELKRILTRKGIISRNLVVDVSDEVLGRVIDRGFDPRWGARAMKREIQSTVVLPLAMTLMEREVLAGQIMRVVIRQDRVQVRLIDTAESRVVKREAAPVKDEAGAQFSLQTGADRTRAVRDQINALAETLLESGIVSERDRLQRMRADPAFWHDARAAAFDLRDLDRMSRVLARLERLREFAGEVEQDLQTSTTRGARAALARKVTRLERAIQRARRELVIIGWRNDWDAILCLDPVGSAEEGFALNRLTRIYRQWATADDRELRWARVPIAKSDPVMLVIRGHYAWGQLRLEAGLHRVRSAKKVTEVVRVSVAPWTDETAKIGFSEHRALKGRGLDGQRVRSRVKTHDGLLLCNELSLSENRDWAAELAPSWAKRDGGDPEGIVRRYQLDPPLIRDALTGWSSGKPNALDPSGLSELLHTRLES